MADMSSAPHQSKSPEGEQKQTQPKISPANGIAASQTGESSSTPKAPAELSNAEKKKLAKAEKAAKRAKAKEGQAAPANGTVVPPSAQSGTSKQVQDAKPSASTNTQHRRTGSMGASSAVPKSLPVRRRQSQSLSNEPKQASKQVEFFAHLYGQPRRRNLDATPKEVHPAVSALALQQSNYIVCGSHARCVAMLLALKAVIGAYTTPHGTSLPRHLASNHLSPQLSYLKSSRPFSTSQANSIRWLKNIIANLDPSMAEDDAKSMICTSIDTFIRERFTIADQVIADATSDRIKDGDVVLTFGKSAVVQAALLQAAERGVQFRVVVADGRPLMEGKHLAQNLKSHVDVTYCLIPGLSHAISGVTKCMLGAHAIVANGAVQARVGSALVAMAAKQRHIPVIVCAESIKLTDRVALNSIIVNELAPEEELINDVLGDRVSTRAETEQSEATKANQSGAKEPKSNKQRPSANDLREARIDGGGGGGTSIAHWEEKENLQLLNMLHDVTPSEYIDLVITELGSFPPSSASVVHRISIGS